MMAKGFLPEDIFGVLSSYLQVVLAELNVENRTSVPEDTPEYGGKLRQIWKIRGVHDFRFVLYQDSIVKTISRFNIRCHFPCHEENAIVSFQM
jgi:hypothetical protein